MPILIALLLFPLLEIALFIQIGREIGIIPTLLALLTAGAIGLILLRLQGWATLTRLQQRLAIGEPPLREAFDGACLALAGVALLLPGFLSDAIALLLLVPPVRGALYRFLARRLQRQGAVPTFKNAAPPVVVDADYVELPQRPLPPQRETDDPTLPPRR